MLLSLRVTQHASNLKPVKRVGSPTGDPTARGKAVDLSRHGLQSREWTITSCLRISFAADIISTRARLIPLWESWI